ncbi:hypothetical protein DICPUDRAFT_158154 [Dictyostelium purpureum]|uniref:Transmembrane protein n=1 Tax=Dictyostelium purpureum TaxID=5786 RepID=F1A0Y7_DICPU|nr:uncharacterized protein DICPUDRAFT_158154 [Dictyostelium purpureum]EGC30150.1 hypothetical protein DICPUDRAFT_158154 [Dictyostelium purpureum]|eukprot:XP_003293333.1 hypothetical protein DICPUDRAFT_158154 [Dictyostelium purpureum]
MKLKIGIALQVVVLVGIVIALILPWYEIKLKENTFTKQTVVNYKWKEFSCQVEGTDKLTVKYDSDDIIDNAAIGACVARAGVNPFKTEEISTVLNSCLSFLVIAGALALGTALLQIILLVSPKLCRSCVWKLLCIGCAIAGVVMLFISFFTLLALPKKFDEDTSNLSVCKERWCDKIIGNDDDYRWIPGGGWWAALAACFTAFCAGIFTLASNR